MKQDKLSEIVVNRGFFFPSAEIYGSKAGFWTYGHLGFMLKKKFENLWRKHFIGLSQNFYEIEDCNMLPENVFKGSGHLKHFNDFITTCKKCNSTYRADELIEEKLKISTAGLEAQSLTKLINKLPCPKCNSALSEVAKFNMMFILNIGAKGEDTMCLRPETAQSPYLAFKREYEALRRKLPLGIAVIGKAFRNEISPRQGFFRLREFTQAELQVFFDEEEINNLNKETWATIKNYKIILSPHNTKAKLHSKLTQETKTCNEINTKLKLPKLYIYYMAQIQKFYLELIKIPKHKFRFRELKEGERAFYNRIHYDIELDLDTLGGFKEVAGLHYRGNHDLFGHQEASGTKLGVIHNNKKLIPHVIELSFGIDRNIWALLDIFYREEKVRNEERSIFSFPTLLSPYDCSIFPLVNKDKLPEMATSVFNTLKENFAVFYDESGSIGRMYRRQDEIGTKYNITIDYQTLKNKTVTIRDRDTMKQIRVKIKDLNNKLSKLLLGKAKFHGK